MTFSEEKAKLGVDKKASGKGIGGGTPNPRFAMSGLNQAFKPVKLCDFFKKHAASAVKPIAETPATNAVETVSYEPSLGVKVTDIDSSPREYDGFDVPVIDNPDAKPENKVEAFNNNPDELWRIWRGNSTTPNMINVVNSLGSTINYALASNDARGDPYLETQAKLAAVEAVKRYDPGTGVSLPTFVASNLKKLTRVVRDAKNPIKIPERAHYALSELRQAETEFADKYGREPDLQELADYSKIPIKQIAKIRRYNIRQVSEGQYFKPNEGETETAASNAEQGKGSSENDDTPDYINEALYNVYTGLDHKERKIFEWSTGFGGSKLLSPKDISDKLGVSQSQISRITAKLAVKVQEQITALEDLYNK